MDTEFQGVSEDGMRAVLETMHAMNQSLCELRQGMAEMSRQCEAATEAVVILQYEVEAIKQNTSRGYIPAGY